MAERFDCANYPRRFVPLLDRALGFSAAVIGFYRGIQADCAGRILGKQLVRAATSIGANVAEAQGGQSRADFVMKLSIAHKEVRETAYWLLVLQEAKIGDAQLRRNLLDEVQQFTRILGASILTAKRPSDKSGRRVTP